MNPTTTSTVPDSTGLGYGVGAYLIWGVMPLYWPLLAPAGVFESLAHRVVWSLVFVLALIVWTGRWQRFAAIARNPTLVLVLALASITIAANWGGFIYGVTSGHVIETSLGYFINPLMTMLLGVLVLKERLRAPQWVAVGIGTVAVVILTVDYGRLPWVALLVAGSFAIYGFLKKRAGLGTFEGLGMETLLLAPVALTFLTVLALRGDLAFGQHGATHTLLLMGTGLLTAVPLLLFGAAATRLPLSTIGILQYLGPILQFVLGLVVFGEDMSTARWLGFVLVWSALVIFTADALQHRRRLLRRTAEASAC